MNLHRIFSGEKIKRALFWHLPIQFSGSKVDGCICNSCTSYLFVSRNRRNRLWIHFPFTRYDISIWLLFDLLVVLSF